MGAERHRCHVRRAGGKGEAGEGNAEEDGALILLRQARHVGGRDEVDHQREADRGERCRREEADAAHLDEAGDRRGRAGEEAPAGGREGDAVVRHEPGEVAA
jgi:hypothetical protein